MTRRVVLASASPARLRLLHDAGLDPTVFVSGVDETTITADTPRELVELLAAAKARDVAGRFVEPAERPVIIGCDSLLDVDGEALGKPGTPEAATERWRRMRGRSGTLLTGHCVIDTATGAEAIGTGATTVHFGRPSDDEIAAYISTGEPLAVAGAFTLDGRGAPFIDRIEGDPSNVIGLSLSLLRKLLQRLDIRIIDLWS